MGANELDYKRIQVMKQQTGCYFVSLPNPFDTRWYIQRFFAYDGRGPHIAVLVIQTGRFPKEIAFERTRGNRC
jgi:hypothetical protein